MPRLFLEMFIGHTLTTNERSLSLSAAPRVFSSSFICPAPLPDVLCIFSFPFALVHDRVLPGEQMFFCNVG